jgi:hypothetical protein
VAFQALHTLMPAATPSNPINPLHSDLPSEPPELTQGQPPTRWSVRLVQRACIKCTFRDYLDLLINPLSIDPRYALWLYDATMNSKSILYELRRGSQDKDVQFQQISFTDRQHSSILKYSLLCDTSASPDQILKAGRRGWRLMLFLHCTAL